MIETHYTVLLLKGWTTLLCYYVQIYTLLTKRKLLIISKSVKHRCYKWLTMDSLPDDITQKIIVIYFAKFSKFA